MSAGGRGRPRTPEQLAPLIEAAVAQGNAAIAEAEAMQQRHEAEHELHYLALGQELQQEACAAGLRPSNRRFVAAVARRYDVPVSAVKRWLQMARRQRCSADEVAEMRALIKAGYWQMAALHHPDKPGGSTDAMQRLVHVRDQLVTWARGAR